MYEQHRCELRFFLFPFYMFFSYAAAFQMGENNTKGNCRRRHIKATLLLTHLLIVVSYVYLEPKL
jgi:hypothetical protein